MRGVDPSGIFDDSTADFISDDGTENDERSHHYTRRARKEDSLIGNIKIVCRQISVKPGLYADVADAVRTAGLEDQSQDMSEENRIHETRLQTAEALQPGDFFT